MNKIATTKRKTIMALFTLLLAATLTVATLLGVSGSGLKGADALSGTSNAYLVGDGQNGAALTEIWDTQSNNFKTDVLEDLTNALLPNGSSDLLDYVNGQSGEVNMTTISTNSGKTNGILVRLGGVDWMVTYLTKVDIDGTPSVVATLYSAENWEAVQFHTSSGTNSQIYNNAEIRNTIKTKVAAKASFLLDTSADGFATKYVVQPKYIPWQQAVNGGDNPRQNNFKYSSTPTGNETAVGAWADDYFWLPSYSETYYSKGGSGGDGGIWKMNAAQRGFTTGISNYCWLRTGSTAYSYYASLLDYSCGDLNSIVNYSYGLRPALHLNLTSAALGAAGGPTDPKDAEVAYTGAEHTLTSIGNSGASAPEWYDKDWYEGVTTQAMDAALVGKPRVTVEYYSGTTRVAGATAAGTYWVKVTLTDAALSERKKEIQNKDPSADLSKVTLKFKGAADTSDSAHAESDTVRWFKLTVSPRNIQLAAPVYSTSSGLQLPVLAGATSFVANDSTAPQIAVKISGTPAGGATYPTTIVGDLAAEADKLPKFKGSYSATAILATKNADGTYTEYQTANYDLQGTDASRTTNFTLNFTALPKLTLTGATELAYTGAALSFAIGGYTDDWKAIATASLSDGLAWNAAGTAVTATDMGTYTVTLAIKEEYKALYGWEGSTNQNTDDVVLTVTVTPAELTLTLPTAANKIYVGQKLSDHAFGVAASGATFTGGSAYCVADGKTVEGTWSWQFPDTAVTKGLTNATVVFTPSSGNYSAATAELSIVPTQITVTVKEIDKKVEESSVHAGKIISTEKYELDFGAVFTFASDSDKNGTLANYAGYTKAYYYGYDVTNGVGTNKINAASVVVDGTNTVDGANNTRNLDVYVGYEAQTVTYKVAHVYQAMDGTVLTEAQIREGLTKAADGTWSVSGYPSTVVEVTEVTATAGTLVSAEVSERVGFAAKATLEGCVSRYQGQAVEGDGSTLLLIYYARQTYKINWMLGGGSLSGKYATEALMEGTVARPEQDPVLHGYNFDGWYLDAEYKNPVASWPVAVDGKDLYFYAKWNVVTYTIYYDYNVGMTGDDVNSGTLHGWGKPSSDLLSQQYSAESFASGALPLPKPTAGGFTFVGWQIRGTDKTVSYIDSSYAQDITLVAVWKHAKITVQFDSNKGSSNIFRKISVTNFGTYPALTAPSARNGYTFAGWYDDPVYGVEVKEGDPIRLSSTQTLYARWIPETYTFTLPEDIFYDKADIRIVLNGEESDEFAEVKVGDRVEITVLPKAGYKIDRNTANAVTVAGNNFRNGNVYVVQPLSGTTEIEIAVILEYEVYNIDYDLAGGRATGNYESRSTSYTIATASLNLPTANDVSREGYNFLNWQYQNDEGDWLVLNDNSLSDFVERAQHAKLYAQWRAKDQTVNLDYNYAGSGAVRTAEGLTGETISIANPARINYVFLGWAETPDGAAVYTPVDGASEYTVTAKENVTLYAKWHIASVQFVVVTVGNNNCVYGAGNKITLSGVPYIKYQDAEQNINLIYRWYKVEEGWQKVTDETSEHYGEYVVPAGATPVSSSTVGAGTSLPLSTPAFYDGITTVAQSGTYVCVLLASDGQTSTTSQGVAEVQMQKADFVGAALSDSTATYDGTLHTVAMSVNGTTVTNSRFNLPDGSTVEATYTYALTGASSQILASAKNAGTYKVTATFKFVKDIGNYNLPDALSANLEILPKQINDLKFSVETNISGLWRPVSASTASDGTLGVVFNTANFRVVATSADVLTADRTGVTIALSQHATGNVLYTAREVGEYLAVAETLEGTLAGNYVLANGLPMQHWNIEKADRDMRGISFANDTFTYDGEAHAFGVNGTLPLGVTVTYTVEFTPWDPMFALDVLGIAPDGFIAAGIYVVTATFADSDSNYNPIEDMVATLTVNRAKYVFDETQLNKDAGVNGMYQSQSVAFVPQANYLPQMQLDAATFEVSYKFERQLILGNDGSWENITATVLKNGGFSSSGKYRVTASVKFVNNAELSNNYGTIDDVTILFSIADGDVKSVDFAHATAGYAYVYGGKLDVDNLSVVIHYANGDEIVKDFSVCTFYETNGTVKGEPFKTFNRVTNNYLIWVECYGNYGIISVKVGQSSFDVSGVAFENAALNVVFDGTNHLPVLANASNNFGIVDAFSKLAVEGVTFKVTYYVGSVNGTFATDAVEYDGTQLLNVGRYKVYAYVEVAGTDNYKEIGLLGVVATVEITALTVDGESGVQLIWQWKKAGESDVDYKNLTDADEFVFFGRNYEFRLYFEGVNNTGSHYAIPSLKLDGIAATEIKNCGVYTLTATSPSANYAFTESAGISVLPKQVDLVWKVNSTNGLDGTDLAATLLTYSGENVLNDVSVYYVDVFGNLIKIDGLKATNGGAVVAAGDYTLTFDSLGDANYAVKDGVATTADITVDPYLVKGDDTDRNIVWQYKDSFGIWQDISSNLTYIGAEYELRLIFTGLGNDGTLKAAVYADGAVVKNATNGTPYTLRAQEIANYSFDATSVTLALSVDKKQVSVSWNYSGAFTYNGKMQSLAATAFGVGGDSKTMLLDVEAMGLNQTAAGNYTAVSALTEWAQTNYELARSEDNLSKDWEIKPAVLNFTWNTDGATVSGGKVTYVYANAAFAPVANPQVAVAGDDHGAKYQIQRKIDGAWVDVAEAKNAGEYRVAVKEVNSNYTLQGAKNTEQAFVIKKAMPIVTGVTYEQYSVDGKINVSYQNNGALRNDKLAYTAQAESLGTVDGSMAFTSDASVLSSVGSVSANWLFTPSDIENFEVVNGTVTLTVLAQTVRELGFEFGSSATNNYLRGMTFNSRGIDVYLVYDSFQKENGELFGRRDLLDKSSVTMKIGTWPAESYTVRTDDVQKTYIEVDCFYTVGGKEITGSFRRNVIPGVPDTIEILQKTELEGLVLYENSVYNLTALLAESIDLKVTYVEESIGTKTYKIDDGMFKLTLNGEAVNDYRLVFTSAGTYVLTVEFVDVSDSLTFTVKAKEKLEISFEDKKAVLEQGATYNIPEPRVTNGGLNKTLAEYGLTVAFTLEDGTSVKSFSTWGTYTIIAKFAFADPDSEFSKRYALPDNVTATFVMMAPDSYALADVVTPETNVTYTGNAVDYRVSGYKIMFGDAEIIPDEVTVTYTVNGAIASATEVSKLIVNVGKYEIELTVNLVKGGNSLELSYSYEISVETAENKIDKVYFSSWKEGATPVEVRVDALFGADRLQCFYLANEATNDWQPYTLEAASTWKAGETYLIKAVIPELSVDGAVNYGEVYILIAASVNVESASTPADENGVVMGEISNKDPDKGVAANGVLNITKVEDEDKIANLTGYIGKVKQEYGQAYEITFTDSKTGNPISADGKYVIRLLIPEELHDKDRLNVFFINEDGVAEDLNATRDGDYLVFETDRFSNFVITTPAPNNAGWIAGVVIGGLVALALVIAVIVIFRKKRKEGNE
ncbi:MAG: InlB B-repeat-containing protein [Corallococcus sp.]|nr:InlB B-repeat-containing protein [Corallococcus sp.]MCM1359741.1 InlB B-repeat-containing protein [Corallococcus sp.]MCM1395450.1 InlB B-repeat-containing protein [Corallococcus sp.]